jgi:beta-lactamase regulating signal transducer with metallopeptidase domain
MERHPQFALVAAGSNGDRANPPSNASHPKRDVRVSLLEVGAGLWAAGAASLLGAWALRGIRARRRILAAAAPVSECLRKRLEKASALVGLVEAPRCVLVSETFAPAIVGIFSNVVVLPHSLEEKLSGDEIDSILVHELIHIRRHDSIAAALQAVIVRLFWFDPVVWLLNRSIDTETEKSCDEAVLRTTANPTSYAKGLLKIVRQSLGTIDLGQIGAASAPIAARLRNILALAGMPVRRRPMRALVGAAFALAALSGFSGAVRVPANVNTPNGKVLVVRDQPSWNRLRNFELQLGDLGYSPLTIASDDMATLDLSQFSLIVIASPQAHRGINSYTETEADRFGRFVHGGGTLLIEVDGPAEDGLLRQYLRTTPDHPHLESTPVP